MGSRWWTGSLQRQHGLLPSSEQTGRGAVANPRALRCRRHAARWNGRLHRDVERAGAGDSLGVAGGGRWGVAGGRPWQRQLKEPGWAWRAWWA